MSELEASELEDLRRSLVRVAGEAAGFLRDMFGVEDLLVTVGVHDGDEGLRVDFEVEGLIVELLRREGFGGVVVGEERGVVRLGSDPLVFVVDPLDGSKNYASMIPWCAVSVAALPAGDPRLENVLAGAVAPVPRLPVVSFARGLGVFEGGSRPVVRRVRPRVFAAYAETVEQARLVYEYLARVGRSLSVRALGSASLEAVWAALGRVEAFADFRGKLRVYDLAAALGVAFEAGARVYVEHGGVDVLRPRRLGVVAITAFEDSWRLLREVLGLGGEG